MREPPLWFGHPRGLSTLFFTELWERFSYYGMRGFLVLFMTHAVATGGLGMDDARAGAIYGLYTAGVYLTALPGGWIADRLTGLRKAVLLGGAFIAAGHFTLAIPSMAAFYTGLILIVLGTGLLKPNVSAMVGDLYPEGGARRDAGFSIYYMGINIGAFLGPLVCGLLAESVSWHLGFSAAGIGMVLGLIQYVLGGKHLGGAGLPPRVDAAERARAWRLLLLGVAVVATLSLLLALLAAVGALGITLVGFAQATGAVIVLIAIAYFGWVLLFGGLDRQQKRRVIVIAIFFVAAAMFWSGFEQAGSSMNLFTERLTDRELRLPGADEDWQMPTSWLQAINPLFIILMAPVLGWLWIALGARNPSLPAKFAYGLVLLGAGFLVLAWGATHASTTKVSPMWLVVTYFLHTVGELCLSPVGLSSITKLSPRHLVGQMMGTWFMGAALGNLMAGLVTGLIESLPMTSIFAIVAAITGGFGLLLLAATPAIKKLVGDVD
jgi:POT family proton-dependent oligopeptide transporter